MVNPRGYLFDLDGVFYIDNTPIPGGNKIIALLRQRKIPFRFVTNTTIRPRKAIVDKLFGLGIEVSEAEIFSTAAAGSLYLKTLGNPVCHLLVEEITKEEFSQFKQADENVDVVVVGDIGEQWNFEVMNHAFRLLMDGAELVALQKGRYYQVSDGLRIDAGVFVAGLEHATGKKATVIGKPQPSFFKLALADMGLTAREVVMVGDDLINDIGGAQSIGIHSILVRTGKFRQAILDQSNVVPDDIIDSIAELKLD